MPKLISLYLIDDAPDGRVSWEIHNWTGKAYRIPRNLLRESADQPDLYKAGVYFLFGRDENDPETSFAYIGKADEVWKRVFQHQDKDFWTEAVVFISKGENLNKAQVAFLVSMIYDAASATKRCRLANSNIPRCPALARAEQAEMLKFLKNLKFLVGAMGYKIFEPLRRRSSKSSKAYHIAPARGVKAQALITNEGVVVTEGSEIATSSVVTLAPATVVLCARLIKDGVIVRDGKKLKFAKSYLFSTLSTATALVMGCPANGRIEWKDSKGHTLRENEED
jgi:hypothetical protein